MSYIKPSELVLGSSTLCAPRKDVLGVPRWELAVDLSWPLGLLGQAEVPS